MNIHAKSGTKVTFTNEGGYEYEQEQALKYLEIGKEYTVDRTVVRNWTTDVYLKEIGDTVTFNSTSFVEVS